MSTDPVQTKKILQNCLHLCAYILKVFIYFHLSILRIYEILANSWLQSFLLVEFCNLVLSVRCQIKTDGQNLLCVEKLWNIKSEQNSVMKNSYMTKYSL